MNKKVYPNIPKLNRGDIIGHQIVGYFHGGEKLTDSDVVYNHLIFQLEKCQALFHALSSLAVQSVRMGGGNASAGEGRKRSKSFGCLAIGSSDCPPRLSKGGRLYR